MSEKNKLITVKPIGRLGNQLFGYFAAKYVAEKLNAELQVDLSFIGKAFNRGESRLDSFNLLDQVIPRRQSPDKFFGMIHNSLIYSSTRFRSIIPIADRYFSLYISDQIGYDPLINSVQQGTTITGYFQSFKYYEFLRCNGFNFSHIPKNPSNWYITMLEEATQTKPIMIHVRRGDYVGLDTYGLLSDKYYLDALEFLFSNYNLDSKSVWIFSDDIDQVRKEFCNYNDYNFNFITEPKDSDPAEVLSIMASGCANIIANSTFSWWAAMLNSNSPVVAPSKWFRKLQDPVDLIPESWDVVHSTWIN